MGGDAEAHHASRGHRAGGVLMSPQFVCGTLLMLLAMYVAWEMLERR